MKTILKNRKLKNKYLFLILKDTGFQFFNEEIQKWKMKIKHFEHNTCFILIKHGTHLKKIIIKWEPRDRKNQHPKKKTAHTPRIT